MEMYLQDPGVLVLVITRDELKNAKCKFMAIFRNFSFGFYLPKTILKWLLWGGGQIARM